MSEIGGGPTPEEINQRNEAEDINQMVDKKILTPTEAGEFDYQEEIEIPEALTQEPPIISEKLRQHIISKFPHEDFKPERAKGHAIQGTSFHAIHPLWTGAGLRKTIYGNIDVTGVYKNIPATKGKFLWLGEVEAVRTWGFGYGPKLHANSPMERIPRCWVDGRHFPLYIVGDKMRGEMAWPHEPLMILLPLHQDKTIESRIQYYQNFIDAFRQEGGRYPTENGGTRHRVLDIASYPFKKNNNKERVDLRKLSDEELINLLQEHINHLSKLKEATDEQLYNWGDEVFMSVRKMANYGANVMLRGIDKSKIVPIYDWDGNLLWPKEEDAKEEKPEELIKRR